MSEIEIELYRGHKAAQERRAYFLIAAAGAAIAFAVTRTETAVWATSMWLWVASIALWGLSFFCGLRHMAYVASTTYGNMDLLKVEGGRHPAVGNHPQMMMAASQGIRCALEINSDRSALFAQLQFGCLITGGAAYLAWHIFEMYLRAAPAIP